MGNSIPHLMTDEDIKKAVKSIYHRINAGGIALIEMRDYDKMLVEQNRFHPMRIHEVQAGYRYSILYVFDYLPHIIRFNIIYLIENMETGEKYMEQESVDYKPIKRADFTAYLKEAGFVRVEYKSGLYVAEK